jgi:hypothetical protein
VTATLYTHAQRETLGSNETSPEVKELWLSLQDIMRNEEAWFILEQFIRTVRGSEKVRDDVFEDQEIPGNPDGHPSDWPKQGLVEQETWP